MPELPHVSLEEEPGGNGNPALRVLGRILLVAAAVPFGLGLLSHLSERALNHTIVLAVLFVVLLPVACFAVALVQYLRKRRSEALGFLLGGVAGPIIGFGTCFAGFSL